MINLTESNLKIIVKILEKYLPNIEVRVFGSRVNGAPKEYSDIDLALMNSKPLNINVLAELKNAFSESNLPIKVDLVEWSSIDDSFKAIINNKFEIIQNEK